MTDRRGQKALLSPESVLQRAADRLAHQFAGMISEETAERVVFESYASLARTATISTHLPSLAERFARSRLTALAQSKGMITKTVPEILYVCVQNSGRSQMAAALTRHLGGERVHVRSAGSQPTETILPAVIAVMSEIGINLGDEFPKPLTDDVVRAADTVVTMGCGDACPLYPGKQYVDWKLPDPAELTLDQLREVRDQISEHVRGLLQELLPTSEVVT